MLIKEIIWHKLLILQIEEEKPREGEVIYLRIHSKMAAEAGLEPRNPLPLNMPGI